MNHSGEEYCGFRFLWLRSLLSAAPPGWRGPCRQRRLRRLNGSRLSPWDERELSQRCSAARATGECCSTTVTRSAARRRSLIRNAKALLPLLLSCRPQTVACLGIATGSSVAGATLHPDVKHVDAIELSPLVLRHAKQFFAPFNRDVFSDARVRYFEEDARWIILRGDFYCGRFRRWSIQHTRKRTH